MGDFVKEALDRALQFSDYDVRVLVKYESLKRGLISNDILRLSCKIDNRFENISYDELVNSLSNQLINYFISEKAFVKLMREGLIYPVNICEGTFHESINYSYRMSSSQSGECLRSISFKRMIFNEFKVV